MSLYEPIMGLLPATESDILSVNPRVNPDTLLYRLRRLERFGAVKRRRDGKYVPVERKTDEPEKTCRRCKQLFAVSELGEKSRCKPCREKDAEDQRARNNSRRLSVVCPSCLTVYGGKRYFKRDGKFHSRCNECHRKSEDKRSRQMRILRGE